MVTELAKSRQPAVRNNLLLALTDMCMHYTLLVDTHLGKVAACMQDPHPLVRKQAVALMACLLQREFVKWRGPLFVQYASLTCRPVECSVHL
jgi:condensin-2 complex subunit D3